MRDLEDASDYGLFGDIIHKYIENRRRDQQERLRKRKRQDRNLDESGQPIGQNQGDDSDDAEPDWTNEHNLGGIQIAPGQVIETDMDRLEEKMKRRMLLERMVGVFFRRAFHFIDLVVGIAEGKRCLCDRKVPWRPPTCQEETKDGETRDHSSQIHDPIVGWIRWHDQAFYRYVVVIIVVITAVVDKGRGPIPWNVGSYALDWPVEGWFFGRHSEDGGLHGGWTEERCREQQSQEDDTVQVDGGHVHGQIETHGETPRRLADEDSVEGIRRSVVRGVIATAVPVDRGQFG